MAEVWEGASPSEIWEGMTPTKADRKAIPEIRQGENRTLRGIVEAATPIVETGAMMGGEIMGGALGGLGGGPLGMAVGSTTGAGIGQMAGEGFIKLVKQGLRLGMTPEQAKRSAYDAFITGAEYSVGGKLAGAALGKAAEFTPKNYAMRGAAKEIEKSRQYSPFEQELIAKRRLEVESSLERLNAPQLPRSVVTGSPRDVALENISRQTMGAEAAARKEITREKSAQALEQTIPTMPGAADILRKKIGVFNADIETRAAAREAEVNNARKMYQDRINAQRKLEEQKAARRGEQIDQRALREAEQKFAQEFESKYGKSLETVNPIQTPKQRIGQNVQSASEAAEEMSQSRFRSEITGYNQPKFIEASPAPESNTLSEFVANNKPPVGFTPSSNPEMKIARMMGVEGEEAVAAELPTMDYRTLREISSAAAKAERTNVANKPVAKYFKDLKSAAESTIVEMLESSGGKELADEYRQLNKLFKEEQVGAFRKGTLGRKILPYGEEFGDAQSAPGDIPQLFKNQDNVTDLIRGLGVEKLSRPAVDPMTVSGKDLQSAIAKTMQSKTQEEILSAGRAEAADLLRPYYQQVLASKYQAVGGGTKGAKSVAAWMRNPENTDVLKQLGLFDEFSAIAKKAEELESKFGTKTKIGSKIPTEMYEAAKYDVVKDTLQIDDPMKLYGYLKQSPNRKQAVADVMRVSRDPAYRNSVKTVVRDGIKSDIDKGVNPFTKSDPKSSALRELLPQVFDKSEIRALKDYHIIRESLEDVSTKGMRQQIEKNAAEKAEEVTGMIPMGYGGYWAKHGMLAFFDKLGIKYGSNVLSVLDQASVNPEFADAIVKAYRKKDPAHLNAILNKSKADQDIVKKLSSAIARGYAASESPDYSTMNEEEWRSAGE